MHATRTLARQQVAQLRYHHHPPRTQFVFGWPRYLSFSIGADLQIMQHHGTQSELDPCNLAARTERTFHLRTQGTHRHLEGDQQQQHEQTLSRSADDATTCSSATNLSTDPAVPH
jgi:hypothetical protein